MNEIWKELDNDFAISSMGNIMDKHTQEIFTDNSNIKTGDLIECVELGAVFLSQKYASKFLNIKQSNISLVINGKLKQTGGYTFRRHVKYGQWK